jgi:HPt (histidine-containing phosphotransfer) domain-containing protein
LPAPREAPRPDTAPAPVAAGESLVVRLAAVPGYDASLGLRNVGGNPATLERLLRRFVSTYGAGVPEFERIADADDRRAARAVCHSLRGASATLGALGFAASIEAFEHSLAPGADASMLQSQAQAMRTALSGLVDMLRRVLGDVIA